MKKILMFMIIAIIISGVAFSVAELTTVHNKELETQTVIEPTPTPTPVPTPTPLNQPSGINQGSFQGTNNVTVDYWVSVPDNAVEDMPLIIWLHGMGEVGRPVSCIREIGAMRMAELASENRFIILQPSGVRDWYKHTQREATIELIDFIVEQYRVDKDRIILTGSSNGAIGAWLYGDYYPDKWAGIVPVSSGPVIEIETLVSAKVPVWAIWSTWDFYGAQDGMQEYVDRMNNAGTHIEVKKTVIPNIPHGQMNNEPYTQEFFDWCFEQERTWLIDEVIE